MKFKKIPKMIGNSWAVFIPMKIMSEFIPGEEIELDIKIPTEKVETPKPEIKEPKPISPKGENGLTTLKVQEKVVVVPKREFFNTEMCPKHIGSRKGTCGCK